MFLYKLLILVSALLSVLLTVLIRYRQNERGAILLLLAFILVLLLVAFATGALLAEHEGFR